MKLPWRTDEVAERQRAHECETVKGPLCADARIVEP